MASVPVVIVGTIKDNDSDEEKQVTITGMASIAGLSVGGGPMPGGPGLGIWGPNDPRPSNPISGIPGLPGYEPPRPPLVIWGPNDPRPSNPIYWPGFPGQPPGGGGGDREPKFEWKTGWSPETGWVVVAIPLFPVVTPST
jgi:hypothetical protein